MPHVGDKVVKEDQEGFGGVVWGLRLEVAIGALLHHALPQPRRDEHRGVTTPDVVARLGDKRLHQRKAIKIMQKQTDIHID